MSPPLLNILKYIIKHPLLSINMLLAPTYFPMGQEVKKIHIDHTKQTIHKFYHKKKQDAFKHNLDICQT